MPDPITRSEFDSLSRQVSSLASALEVASISAGQSRHMPDVLHHIEQHARELSTLKHAISSLSKESIAALIRREIASAIETHLAVRANALADATGRVLREERANRDQQIKAAVSGVQTDAELARATAKSNLEAAEAIITGELYRFAGEMVTEFERDTTREVESLFTRQDAAFAKATAEHLLSTPSSNSVGDLVVALAIGAKTPTSSVDLIQLDFHSGLNKILKSIEPIRQNGDMLASIADYLGGRGALHKDVQGHLRAAAETLRVGSCTGYPVRELAEKLDLKVMEGLGTLKDFESRMFRRWRKSLTIAAVSNKEKFYRRTGDKIQERHCRENLKTLRDEYRSLYSNNPPRKSK